MSKKRALLGSTLVLLLAWRGAYGQAQPHPTKGHHGHTSPYAKEADSGIAGLSQQELDGLREGRGMGMARPAELNHYPGPKHVLELAAELGLDGPEREAVERVFAAMSSEARRIGAAVIEAEQHLDRRFAQRHIDDKTLKQATEEIGVLMAELRYVHLRAHLETASLLSPEQIRSYDRLRGYEAGQGSSTLPRKSVPDGR